MNHFKDFEILYTSIILNFNVSLISRKHYFASFIRDKLRQVVESVLATPNYFFSWQDNSRCLTDMFFQKCLNEETLFTEITLIRLDIEMNFIHVIF